MNYELPDDVVVDNKPFASTFLVEALGGLLDATKEIEKNIDELEKVSNSFILIVFY